MWRRRRCTLLKVVLPLFIILRQCLLPGGVVSTPLRCVSKWFKKLQAMQLPPSSLRDFFGAICLAPISGADLPRVQVRISTQGLANSRRTLQREEESQNYTVWAEITSFGGISREPQPSRRHTTELGGQLCSHEPDLVATSGYLELSWQCRRSTDQRTGSATNSAECTAHMYHGVLLWLPPSSFTAFPGHLS